MIVEHPVRWVSELFCWRLRDAKGDTLAEIHMGIDCRYHVSVRNKLGRWAFRRLDDALGCVRDVAGLPQ